MAFIQSLRLTDFRSYDALDLELSEKPVVLFGPNGAGKTNLLEAISFLSPGRGLRRAQIEDVARKSEGLTAPAWGLVAGVNSDTDSVKIAVGQVPEYPRRRTVRIDGQNVSGNRLTDYLTLMWLTPAQDRLFTGPASERRKFLDRFTLIHTPDHGQRVLRYEKARTERNRLLSEHIQDAGWYDAIEADMAAHGASIAHARVRTVENLITEIAARPEGAFPKAQIELDGEVEKQISKTRNPDATIDFMRSLLLSNRPLDLRAGRTLRGVHKSDLRVTHATKSMPAEACSTGEQKALLIGLFLAHARAQADCKPLLLLDEVAAHLDHNRRAALIEELLALRTQIFMTGTDASLFEAFDGRAQMFEVKDGKIYIR